MAGTEQNGAVIRIEVEVSIYGGGKKSADDRGLSMRSGTRRRPAGITMHIYIIPAKSNPASDKCR